MSRKTAAKKVMTWGLLLLGCGYISNIIFILLGIVGYLREMARLTILIGGILIIVAIIQYIIAYVSKRN